MGEGQDRIQFSIRLCIQPKWRAKPSPCVYSSLAECFKVVSSNPLYLNQQKMASDAHAHSSLAEWFKMVSAHLSGAEGDLSDRLGIVREARQHHRQAGPDVRGEAWAEGGGQEGQHPQHTLAHGELGVPAQRQQVAQHLGGTERGGGGGGRRRREVIPSCQKPAY